MKIKSLRQIKKLAGRTVFLRVDFNVPLVGGKISDDHKIRAGLETIQFLLDKGARVIIATHLGDPGGKENKKYSTRILARHLGRLLNRPVKFIPESVGPMVSRAVSRLAGGELVFLENLRFHKGELDNDQAFAADLAGLADLYVNDAFAVCHRRQASVAAITKNLPSYAGLLLEKEIRALHNILKPKKPLVVILGGAKIETKTPLIARLIRPAHRILIGGALANNFFKFQKMEIGRSLYDPGSYQEVKKFFSGRKLNSKIILPIDVVVRTKKGGTRCRPVNGVGKGEIISDIGPQTISLFSGQVKKAATIVWNGPMGKFEDDPFRYGSLAVARLVASRAKGPAFGLVGGGETVEVLKMSKMSEYVDLVSTAGGAMLSFLAGEDMPGLKSVISK